MKWASAHFLVAELPMLVDELESLLAPEVAQIGYELIDVEFQSSGGRDTLRLFIDGPDGIGLDDCAAVSDTVSGILDVEDPIPGEYELEVSSPGLDRPLRRVAHYQRFTGSLIKVRMRRGFVGRKRLKGRLESLLEHESGATVVVSVDGTRHELPLEDIDSARLVPELEIGGSRMGTTS
ncbi:MAG: ribosome maturation factor RimP [Pseudomonadota bacterium]